VTAHGGTIILEGVSQSFSKSMLVKMRDPILFVQGGAYFDRARIYINHYKLPLFYDDGANPFVVNGTVSFKTEYSDSGITLMENFTFNGTGKQLFPSASSFNEMDIPWSKVLISPLNFLLLGVIATISILVLFASKKNVHADRLN
jgi:hypothetical protein